MAGQLYVLTSVRNCPDRVEGWDLRRNILRNFMWLTTSNMRHHVSKVVQNYAGRDGEVVGGWLRLKATTERCHEFVHAHLRA